MDISVIIVNYNVREYIISCIESIYKHTDSKINFEIIVVDNNSCDKSVESLEEYFPKIILIKNNYNAYFSAAVNQAAEVSSGKFLFILNPDTFLVEDSFSRILCSIKNLNKFGGIGPKMISDTGKMHKSFWEFPTLLSTILSLFHLDFLNNKKLLNSKLNNTCKVESISGGALFLPKKIFLNANGFNTSLFWMEDIDLCLQINKLGYQIYYTSSTKIIHYIGKSAQKNLKIAIENQLTSKIKYFGLNHDMMQMIIIKIAVLVVSFTKTLVFLLLYPFSNQGREKFHAYLNAFITVLFNKFK